ncbi:hypothetical protein PCE1_002801 [Barthelona sp. PCE]
MSLLENIQRWVDDHRMLDKSFEELKQVSFSFTSLKIHINESNSFKFDLTCKETNQSATIKFEYDFKLICIDAQSTAKPPTLLDVFCLYIGFKLIISNPRIHSLTKWIYFLLYRSVSLPEEISLRVFDSIEIEKLLKSVSPWSGDITIVVENLVSLYSSFISNYQRHFISLLAASGFFSLFPYERTGFKTFWSAVNSKSLNSAETTKFIICRNVESLHTVLLYDNLCPELDFSDCSDPETVKIIMESIGTSEVNIPFDFGNNQHSEEDSILTSAFKKKKIWSLLSKHVDIYEAYPPFFELELHEKLSFLGGFVSDSKISDHNVKESLKIASEGSDEAVMKVIWSNTRRPVDLFINDDGSVDVDLFNFIPVFETFDFFHLSDSIVGNIIERFMEHPGYNNYININGVWSCLRCKVAAHRIVLHNHEVRDFFRSSFSDDDRALHMDPFYSEDVHPEQQELKDIYQRKYDRIIAGESEISQINNVAIPKTKLYRHEKVNKLDFLIFFVNQLIDFTSKDPLMQIVFNIVFQGYPPLDDFSHFPDVRFQNFILNVMKQIHKDNFIFRFCFILFSFIPFSHVKNSIKIFLGLDSDRHMLIQKIQKDYWYLFFNTWSNISSPLIDCLKFKSPYITILASEFWSPSYIPPVTQPVLFKILWYTTCNPSNLLQHCWDTVLQVCDPVYLFYEGQKLNKLHLVLYLEASSAKYVQQLSRESCIRILSDLCSFSTYEHVKRWWESISTLFNPILFRNVHFVKCFVPKNFESLDKQLCIDIIKSVKHKYYVEMSKDSGLDIVESFTSADTLYVDMSNIDQETGLSVIRSFIKERFGMNWDIELLEKLFHSFLNSNHEMVDSIKFDKTHISYWAFSLIFLENPNTQFFKKQSSTLFSNPSKHIKITQFSDFISSYFDNSDDFTSLSGIKNAMLKFEEEHCFMPIIQNQMGLFNMCVINNLQSMKIVIDKQNFAEFLKFLVNEVMLFEADISNLWNSFKHNKYYMEIMCENEEIFNLFASNLQLQDCAHLDIKQCSKLLGFGVSLNDSDRSTLWQLLPLNVDAIIKCDGENKEDVFKKFVPLLKVADCMHLEKADCLDLLTMGSKTFNFNHSMLWHVLPSPLKAILANEHLCREYLQYVTLTDCANFNVEQCAKLLKYGADEGITNMIWQVLPSKSRILAAVNNDYYDEDEAIFDSYFNMFSISDCVHLDTADCVKLLSFGTRVSFALEATSDVQYKEQLLNIWQTIPYPATIFLTYYYHLFLTYVPIINRSHLMDLSDEDLITVCKNILKFSVEHPNSISVSLWNGMNDCVKLVKFLEFDSYVANKHLIRPNDYDTLHHKYIVKILEFQLNDEEDKRRRWKYMSYIRNPLQSILNDIKEDEVGHPVNIDKLQLFMDSVDFCFQSNFHNLTSDEQEVLRLYLTTIESKELLKVLRKLKELSVDLKYLMDLSNENNVRTVCENILKFSVEHPNSISVSLWNGMNDCVKLVKFLEFDSYMANKHLIRPNDYDTLHHKYIVKILEFQLNDEEDKRRRWKYMSYIRNPLQSILNDIKEDEVGHPVNIDKLQLFMDSVDFCFQSNFHNLTSDEQEVLSLYLATIESKELLKVLEKLKELSVDLKYLKGVRSVNAAKIVSYADCHPEYKFYDAIDKHRKKFYSDFQAKQLKNDKTRFVSSNNSAIAFYDVGDRKQFEKKGCFICCSVMYTILFFLCLSIIFFAAVYFPHNRKLLVFDGTDDLVFSFDTTRNWFNFNVNPDKPLPMNEYLLIVGSLLFVTIILGLFSKRENAHDGWFCSYIFGIIFSVLAIFGNVCYNGFIGLPSLFAGISLLCCIWSPQLSFSFLMFSVVPLFCWTNWWEDLDIKGSFFLTTVIGTIVTAVFEAYISSIAILVLFIGSIFTAFFNSSVKFWDLVCIIIVLLLVGIVVLGILVVCIHSQKKIIDVSNGKNENCHFQIKITEDNDKDKGKEKYTHVGVEKHSELFYPENHSQFYTLVDKSNKRIRYMFPWFRVFGSPSWYKTKSMAFVSYKEYVDNKQEDDTMFAFKNVVNTYNYDIYGLHTIANMLSDIISSDPDFFKHLEIHLVVITEKNESSSMIPRFRDALECFKPNFQLEDSHMGIHPVNDVKKSACDVTMLLHNKTVGVIPFIVRFVELN